MKKFDIFLLFIAIVNIPIFAVSYHDVSDNSYTHYESSHYGLCSADKISDDIYAQVYNDAWQANGYSGWVTIQLPQAEKVEILRINRVYYKLKDFQFYGSNNNQNWTELYSGTSPNSLGWISFDLNNTDYYEYYKINVNNTWGDYAIIYEWELLADDAPPVPEPACFSLIAMAILYMLYQQKRSK